MSTIGNGMGQLDESGQLTRFPLWKASRNSFTSGVAAATTAGLMSAQGGDPVAASYVMAGAFGYTFVGSFVGEFTNHIYDDPHPVFDLGTTVLFNLVGMTVCFFFFVVPAMILGALITPGEFILPGFFGYVAYGLSGFFVAILRGLLINLRVVRDEAHSDIDKPDHPIVSG